MNMLPQSNCNTYSLRGIHLGMVNGACWNNMLYLSQFHSSASNLSKQSRNHLSDRGTSNLYAAATWTRHVRRRHWRTHSLQKQTCTYRMLPWYLLRLHPLLWQRKYLPWDEKLPAPKRNPVIKGSAHAIVGIVAGACTIIFHLCAVGAVVAGILG